MGIDEKMASKSGKKDSHSKKMVIDPERRSNELDGKTWIKYSISIWDLKKTPQEQAFGHPAMFPVELCDRLISIFTRKGQTVLDPFVGSASTLVASVRLGRKGIGFEISPEFVALAKRRLSQRTLDGPPLAVEVIQDDARNLAKRLPPESVDFVLTSPPYWDILRLKRTADYKDSRPYSELEEDLGNLGDYEQFLNELAIVFKHVFTVLMAGRYCVVIVMDIRKQNRFWPYHMDITKMMTKIGFILDDIVIWDRHKEYNNLRALGYPYVFRVNKVHEYILIFKKPSGESGTNGVVSNNGLS